jgi:hypothetical protein
MVNNILNNMVSKYCELYQKSPYFRMGERLGDYFTSILGLIFSRDNKQIIIDQSHVNIINQVVRIHFHAQRELTFLSIMLLWIAPYFTRSIFSGE